MKLNLKNLKKQSLDNEEMKNLKGSGFPGYYCGDYYCTNVNPNACCC